METKIKLKDVVGGGYYAYWNSEHRYRVCKGSRRSKKSKTTALNFIFRLIKFPMSNLVVIRKTYRSLKDSCYTDLLWAIDRLGVTKLFSSKKSPLEIEYKPTGQIILFRGLDDPKNLHSLSVRVGSLCWAWFEEAYQIESEEIYQSVSEGLMGDIRPPLFRQDTLTFNPWNAGHWLKKRFFDNPADDTYSLTTNYTVNEWLPESALKEFDDMKKRNYKRFLVAGLGEWGQSEGLVFENFECNLDFNIDEIRKSYKSVFGLDFGYNDPHAMFCGAVDSKNKRIFVFDEIYICGVTLDNLAEMIKRKGYANEKITCDSAVPEFPIRLRSLGLPRVLPAKKGPGSVEAGIDFLLDYEILIHKNCINFMKEINNYAYQVNKLGQKLNVPEDKNNHLMDAMRYAVEGERNSGGIYFG